LIKPDRDPYLKAGINSNLSKITVRSEAVGWQDAGASLPLFGLSISKFYTNLA
jgi:hypothetical protein